MTLQEQLERIDTDLKRNEERKRELQEKRKKVLGEIELENAKKAAEKNQKIVEVISESFGEVTEDLQSVRVPGIYFAGEMLDLDGICGGYNLQWAWSSGAVAGWAAAGKPLQEG